MFEIEEVTVRYGQRVALGPVTAELELGTSVALMGPNGSGKTTMLRLLAGLVAPTTGAITVSGPPGIGYVGQHQDQHRWLPITVREVVTAARYRDRGLIGRMRPDDKSRVTDALDRMGVDDLASRSYGELSGGQRQRVLVAAAVAADTPVLLLDEPITGLDIPSQQLILGVIREESERGRLVVVSTHHLDEARHCDRVLLLNTRVIADGVPDEVLVRGNLEATFGAHSLTVGPAGMSLIDDHGHGTHPMETTP